MLEFSDLFSSKAKFNVLRMLFLQSLPISLRQIAMISNVGLYSVQRSLNQLVHDGIVLQKRSGQYRLFRLDPKNIYFDVLSRIFEIEISSRIQFQRQRWQSKAKAALLFSSSAIQLFEGRIK
jgi:hypothetical protein